MCSPPSPLSTSGSPSQSQPRGCRRGAQRPTTFYHFDKVDLGQPWRDCYLFSPFFPARGKHRIGKAGSEGWINYLQRVHHLSRFPSRICSKQLHCSAAVGFLRGPVSAGGDRPSGYFCRLGAPILQVQALLLLLYILQEESREQR